MANLEQEAEMRERQKQYLDFLDDEVSSTSTAVQRLTDWSVERRRNVRRSDQGHDQEERGASDRERE